MVRADPYVAKIAQAIQSYIDSQLTDGTVSMSKANLKQTVSPPSGGPSGTNAQYIYGQMFDEAIQSLTGKYKKFVQ